MINVGSNFPTVIKRIGERESFSSVDKHTNWPTLCKQRHK